MERSVTTNGDPKAPAGDPPPSGTKRDRALVLGQLPDQKALAVLRQRGEDAPVEAGIVRSLREGEPITGEVVSLKPTAEGSPLCDVEVHLDRSQMTHKGPARVASPAYRSGWDAVFGGERDRGAPGTALN